MLEEYLQPKIRQKKQKQNSTSGDNSVARGGDSPLDFKQTEFRKNFQSDLSASKSGSATAVSLSSFRMG